MQGSSVVMGQHTAAVGPGFFGFARLAAADNRARWEDKADKAVFRGSTTGALSEGQTWKDLPRARAAMLSQQHPLLLDAGLTSVVQLPRPEETRAELERLGLMKSWISAEDQVLRYKMVLNLDGNSLADRFPHQLVGNSIILKQNSPHAEYWYEELVPNVHYIPVARDLGDLVPTIERFFALGDDDDEEDAAQNITDAATEFVLRRLSPESCWCYWASLLQGLAGYTGAVRLSQGHRRWRW